MKIISNSPWTGRLMKPRDDFRPVRWGFGFEAPGRCLSSLGFALGPEMVGSDIRLRLWHRADASVQSAFDTAIFSTAPLHDTVQSIPAPELHGPIAQFQWLPLPGIRCKSGLYVCEISAPYAGSEQPFGIGVSELEQPWDWQAGWFMVEGRSPRPAKLPAGVAWLIGEGGSGASDGQIPIMSDQRTEAGVFRLDLPPLEIRRSGWVLSLPASAVAVPRPTSHDAVAVLEAGVSELRLPFRYVELLEAPAQVELVFNPARLVRSGDLSLDATVKYRGWDSRYDRISVCSASGRLHLTEGPNRGLDPEEFPASVPPGHQPLFSVYTTHEAVEAMRTDNWRDLVRCGSEDRHLAWLEYCRRRLPRTLRILRSGGDLRLIGYGDSVTSLGARHADQTRFANGPSRDNFGYFEQYGEDWIRDEVRRSGIRLDGVPQHRFGWNWQLKDTIEQRWPVSVEYLNWGIPGTTTGPDVMSVEGGIHVPNGSNEQRLERMLSDGPDLVVVAFGTNDVGLGIDTRANLVGMVDAITAVGSEVILVPPCPPNPAWGSRDPLLWMQTYDAVLSAALDADVAYVPTSEIFGAGREGALGLSQRSYSAASMGNHPGARELKAVGRLLSFIIP